MKTELETSKSVCPTFLQEYTDTFARNFTACSKEIASGSISEKALLMVGTEVFRILFLSPDDKDHIRNIFDVYKKLIHCTKKAYTIMSRTWLIMARDVIDHLMIQESGLVSLEIFLHQLNELSELLIDVYFEESRVHTASKPTVDTTTPEYTETISAFSQYLEKSDNANNQEDVDELRIHTYYRSIPIELNATVTQVDSQSVTFKVHPYEAVALSSMGVALIKSSLHLSVFLAYITNVDIKQRTATLSHFTSFKHPLERRENIRVEPNSIIKSRIILGDQEVEGRIYDLSEVAVAIYIKNTDIEQYSPGKTVNLIADLPEVYDNETIAINVTGTITMIHNNVGNDDTAHRIVIHWNPDPPLKSKLSQYISQSQVAVMKELKELSEA